MLNAKIKAQIKQLSTTSGVYIFKNKIGEIIYVGKATNLKNRVGSYFRFLSDTNLRINANDVNMQMGMVRPIERMISQVEKIKTIETETVLEALILEANLIKKHQPKYNVEGKDDKTFSYIVITKEYFPRVLILRETDLNSIKNLKLKIKNENHEVDKKIHNSKFIIQNSFIYGPYTSNAQIQIALKIIRKIFPYHSRNEKSEKGCLEFQLGLCPGPYAGAISKADYKKNIQGIKMILSGKKKNLLKLLEKEMQKYSKEEKFERAQEAKNKIFALKHIQEIALLSGEVKSSANKDFRVEAYDISNISGEFAVGSMVVFTGGEPDKAQYRKFKIKTVAGSNDTAMMREVLLRRLRNNWKLPDLMILDGGRGHLNMGIRVLGENSIAIPLIGVAKGAERKKIEVVGADNIKNKKILNILSDTKLLKRITDEAHRFAITYHKKIRDKEFRIS
ncbi:MAG: Excinuclease ABC subunit C [Candidatus Moranbacteria bacterium GW2011_GWE1_35_17]|nr:MAG: Excinuclease ABC subunit C [Candidatus Moranbacteria bacterium GW2011_GWE1_35_17]KKP81242.1 MAG: Excinuclease ABC subunit C [Candidatus Moranbacteria bacterium GW2011_GWF1_35_5]KKP82040.1 MAG: Excinuclease ABC subunit C [Candidatus Moranbacteria bacterium GW2011_GWF2_35_54]